MSQLALTQVTDVEKTGYRLEPVMPAGRRCLLDTTGIAPAQHRNWPGCWFFANDGRRILPDAEQ